MTARSERVADAYGLSRTEVARWGDKTLSVFERKAAQLGLPGFTTPTPTCEDEDESEILPW
jgi:hypothetical protein